MRIGDVKTGTGPDDFYRMVLAEMNCSIVEAVYSVLDRLNAELPQRCGIKLACQSGCSLCCEQIVNVTMPEWELVEEFLRQGDLLSKHAEQFARAITEFTRYSKGVLHDPIRLTMASLGHPCIFLKRGRCVIYAVRPLVCRTTTSTRRCGSIVGQSGGQQMRFDYEHYANNLVLETTQLAQGFMGVTPLPYLVGMMMAKMPGMGVT